jgi:hypothetical protein
MQATGKPNKSRGVPPERLYCSGCVTLTCGNPYGEREGYAYVTKSKNPSYWVENPIAKGRGQRALMQKGKD